MKKYVAMQKKMICVLMVVLMSISIFSFSVSANNEILVLLDGELLEFDVEPQIINGRTMVPMRKIFESLGATVYWDGNTKKITATRQDKTIIMQIDNTVLFVNGNSITLDVPPQLVDGRTLVPVRAVAESFDINVIWDADDSVVLLSTYIPFDTPIETFNYLGNWLIENGEAFGEYVYIGWYVEDGVSAEIRYYPEGGGIGFWLDSYENDSVVTSVNLWSTYDGTDIYATYISGSHTCKIDGYINMEMHTNNYPLSYRECDPGEFETTYNMLEDTRQRINYLLEECAILLSYNNTKVTLTTLGFKRY